MLIRHAAHAQLGAVLSGRLPGLPLNPRGRAQAERLARRLADEPLAALHASPVQRAQETAASIARAQPGLAVTTIAALDEVDFGEWQGQAFTDLAADPRWAEWNAHRAAAIAPGGEAMASAQERAWAHVARTARDAAGETIAMVTHCDIIRALVARILGLSLDRLLAFEVGPASLTRIELGEWGARLLSLNETVEGANHG